MGEQEIIFEEVSLADAEELLEFLHQVIKETDLITIDDQMISSLSDAQTFIEKQTQKVDSICLLAKLGSEIIGLVNLVGQDEEADLFIAVKKSYWGYGIGSTLMDLAIEWANHTSDVSNLTLTVQKRNIRAVNLYQRNGFTITQESSILLDGERIVILAMKKEI